MTDTTTDERDESTTETVTRRALLAAIGIAGAGASGYFVASVEATPSGVYPESTDDPFKKLRGDRIRYISRTSQPSAPASGRVVTYVDDGDIP